MQETILIIGAGPAGLYAAYLLSATGNDVTILEARERAGGRIQSKRPDGFSMPIETGAEFIHGQAPITNQLLKKGRLNANQLNGNFFRSKNGGISRDDILQEQAGVLMEKLSSIETDISVKRFLEKEFSSPDYALLRKSMIDYVEGYDAADSNRASALALRENWKDENSDKQARITGGYDQLVHFLLSACLRQHCRFRFNSNASKIEWQKGYVRVQANENYYEAQRLIFTAPLNLITHPQTTVSFDPSIPHLQEAVPKLGFGNVIKVILEFETPFWQSITLDGKTEKPFEFSSFVFSDEPIPTWWTQEPGAANILTGWIAGPRTERFSDYTDNKFEEEAIQSISRIFAMTVEELAARKKGFSVTNWSKELYNRAAYSYKTTETSEALQQLNTPVFDTIYFAGEALNSQGEVGTVEAAFSSASKVVEKISGKNRE